MKKQNCCTSLENAMELLDIVGELHLNLAFAHFFNPLGFFMPPH